MNFRGKKKSTIRRLLRLTMVVLYFIGVQRVTWEETNLLLLLSEVGGGFRETQVCSTRSLFIFGSRG